MKETPHSNESEKNKKPKKLGKLPLAPPVDPTLKWSPEKHDLKVETFQQDEAKKKAMLIIGRCYLSWKRDLERAIKRAKGKFTGQDLVTRLYDLHGQVGKACQHTPGMKEFREFTMSMIEDRISEIIATKGLQLNLFAEYLPPNPTTTGLTVPEKHTFGNLDEFIEIPYLKAFKDKVGFIGFIREGKGIFALFEGGEHTPVGVVLTLDCEIERLPTRLQMSKELEKSEKPSDTQSS